MKNLFILLIAGLFSLSAKAYREVVRFKTTSASISRTAVENDLRGDMRQERSLSLTRLRDIYEDRYYYDYVKYKDYVCTTTPTNGKGNWHGFYNVRGRDAKSFALQKAIKGVGPKTAPKLIDTFLKGKPRTWKAFQDVISRADQKIDGLFYRVIVKYGEENRKNLGYSEEQDCKVVWREKRVLKVKEVLVDTLIDFQKDYTIELFVENAPLLKGEKETYVLGLSAENYRGRTKVVPTFSVRGKKNYYERATFVDGDTYFRVMAKGKGRILLTPNKSDIHVSAKLVNGRMVLDITNNLKERLSELGGSIIIEGKIKRSSWLLDPTELELNLTIDGKTLIKKNVSTGYYLEKSGKKYYFDYKIKVVGNKFYDYKSSSRSNESNKIKR